MRRVILTETSQITPFNEPARDLRVHNVPLWLWQRDVLDSFVTEEREYANWTEAKRAESDDPAESLVHSDNLFFNKAFNRGPFRTSGGSAIVNATAWSTQGTFEVPHLPSERVIMDLSDWQSSQSIHPTGQSGHAYHPHYIDMADPWSLIEYHTQHWDRAEIEAHAVGFLRLLP